DNYSTAANYFERILAGGGRDGIDLNTRNDAMARAADSYLANINYSKAANYYDRLIASGAQRQDYALFQKGILLGLQGDNNGKISTLNSVIAKYPKSNYADDVAFEIPYTYFLIGDHDRAIDGLQKM